MSQSEVRAGSEAGEERGGLKPALLLGALGVVYGDIGTSPLYAFKEAVRAAHPGAHSADPAAVTGAVSLILWALILIVSIKYAVLILRADNRGEGGIVAMLALLGARHARPHSWQSLLLVVGLVGAALLYGDGAITPAISVLSAVEGLKVDAPALGRFVVPITLAILVALFLVQSKGVAFIGRMFGPVMLVWFCVLVLLGLGGIWHRPEILAAANPLKAVEFMGHAGWGVSFAMLGAAFLAVTGGEAMYADLGHFGAGPIRVSWFALVLPALVINYLGQGAGLLLEPDAIENPFYRLAPDWAHYPLIGLATLATVIASQAIISGVFSLTQQSIQLGFLPAMRIVQTAPDERGQIYVPAVNWLLAAATLTAVVVFETSDALAGAYGIAVSLLMAITTILAALIAHRWGYALPAVIAVNGFFLLIDLVFLSANSVKLFEGGWFPLVLAGFVALMMLTWRRGNQLIEEARVELRQPESAFLTNLQHRDIVRLPGTGAFLSAATHGIPLHLSRFVERSHALHRRVVIVTALYEETPTVPETERARATLLAPDFYRLILRYGFMEDASIPEGLRCAVEHRHLPAAILDDLTVFIGHETVIPKSDDRGMMPWRENLFAFMQRNAERTGAYFCVPTRQVVEVGTEIEI
ncbi:potassium transporter Kup [Methylobacterium gregans]|uniref:Probable potassium transport system protein Kup n=1 Tax=Methylobacterium gregans TaxID=374424 RepID=A0AA37MH10_9HYPH|nr:KUP system potassium uptake protein [Methylobacterium gregans]GJD81316.1 Low affinity potassium transport system protein kup [Methylobacterium gregans]GLS52321.1 putative potassium transport system protein kup 3 [Methylobacterium gregans]